MLEGKPPGVEELPLHPSTQGFSPWPNFAVHPALPAQTIHGIPDYRVPDVCEVNPNLMGPPRAQRYPQQLSAEPSFHDAKARHSVSPLLYDRHTLPLHRITPDRRSNLKR
jgi:hypothetical protein